MAIVISYYREWLYTSVSLCLSVGVHWCPCLHVENHNLHSPITTGISGRWQQLIIYKMLIELNLQDVYISLPTFHIDEVRKYRIQYFSEGNKENLSTCSTDESIIDHMRSHLSLKKHSIYHQGKWLQRKFVFKTTFSIAISSSHVLDMQIFCVNRSLCLCDVKRSCSEAPLWAEYSTQPRQETVRQIMYKLGLMWLTTTSPAERSSVSVYWPLKTR